MGLCQFMGRSSRYYPLISPRLLQFVGASPLQQGRRFISIFESLKSSPVIISSNKDIYTNLALEHLLFNELRFEDLTCKEVKAGDIKLLRKPVVLIWTDEPCVVIGRHQNPWIETNLSFLNKSSIKLARRHSGGGCVYHDENNINISIIGHRKDFENRQANLRFLSQFLDSHYGIKSEPNRRHDLVQSGTGFKLTGSAAKLGRYNCYHHFTLLVDTNKENLYCSIRQKPLDFIRTNSSVSTRSKVVNLKEIRSDLDTNQVISDLAIAYGKLYKDSAGKLPAQKDRVEGDQIESEAISEFRNELRSWAWIYAMTPKFSMERTIPVIEGGVEKQVKFSAHINKGLFENIEISGGVMKGSSSETFKSLIGTKFDHKEAMVNITKLLQPSGENFKTVDSEKVFGMFLLQMVHESHI